MIQSLYEFFWIFFIYAVLGWCTEVIYAGIKKGKFINRGFLNGPFCPIYGFGVLLVIILLNPLKENLILLFIGSIILTSIIEYITGFVLEKVFQNKWWDYSDKKFNLHGYVCIPFSIMWGLTCVFIVIVLQPVILLFIRVIPRGLGIAFLSIAIIFFLTDVVVTVMTITNFNRRLKLLDEMAAKMKVLSDDLGENIFENVSGVVEKKAKLSEVSENLIHDFAQKKDKLSYNVENQYKKMNESVKDSVKLALQSGTDYKNVIESKLSEYNSLKDIYTELLEKKNYGQNRLMKAFPNMKSIKNNESLQKLKEEIIKHLKRERD